MRGSGVPDGGVRRSIGSAPGPFAGPWLECPGTAAVDQGLDKREEVPLDRGSVKDLLEVVLAFERFAFGGSDRSPGVTRRQTCLKTMPPRSPPCATVLSHCPRMRVQVDAFGSVTGPMRTSPATICERTVASTTTTGQLAE